MPEFSIIQSIPYAYFSECLLNSFKSLGSSLVVRKTEPAVRPEGVNSAQKEFLFQGEAKPGLGQNR